MIVPMVRRIAAGCGLAVLVVACASEPETVRCPVTAIVRDTSQVTRFRGGGRDLTDVSYRVRILQTARTCAQRQDAVDATLLVRFEGDRGPANVSGNAPIRYFVAVADPAKRILAREAFDLDLPFEKGTKVLVTDEVSTNIPLPEGAVAEDYTIYIGLIMSRQELEYNRRNL